MSQEILSPGQPMLALSPPDSGFLIRVPTNMILSESDSAALLDWIRCAVMTRFKAGQRIMIDLEIRSLLPNPSNPPVQAT